jgi:hypothetical protein
MDVSGPLHAPAPLPPSKEPTAPKPVWTLWRNEKSWQPQNQVANYIFLLNGFQAPKKLRVNMNFEEENMDLYDTLFSDPW